jgi:hypothetical protein
MSSLTATEALALTEPEAHGAAMEESGPRRRRLKAVGALVTSRGAESVVDAVGGCQPRSSSIPAASNGPLARPRNDRGAGVASPVPPGLINAGTVTAGRVSSGRAASGTISPVPVLAGSIWAGPVPIRAVPTAVANGAASDKRMQAGPPAAGSTSRAGVSRRAGDSGTRLRLTRRGRLVVAALIIVTVTAAALLITLLASGGAQATNHGQARAGYEGMHKIVVQPGQTLWSIASTADPSADPRIVIQEIMTANTLAGPNVTAGQLLWVPR